MAQESVVLVHGLWVHGLLMTWMQRRLMRAGYNVHCFSYRSVRVSLSENARQLAQYCESKKLHRAHLVGHSLGGLLIAKMLEQRPDLAPGRLVFMGSPFADSHAARCLGRTSAGKTALGASIAEWLLDPKAVNFSRHELGVIAGDGGFGLGVMVARDLPRPHDGAVCVAETHVPGMRDHVVLPVSHTQMVISPRVVNQVCEFLRRGRFAAERSS